MDFTKELKEALNREITEYPKYVLDLVGTIFAAQSLAKPDSRNERNKVEHSAFGLKVTETLLRGMNEVEASMSCCVTEEERVKLSKAHSTLKTLSHHLTKKPARSKDVGSTSLGEQLAGVNNQLQMQIRHSASFATMVLLFQEILIRHCSQGHVDYRGPPQLDRKPEGEIQTDDQK
jgi:hypothetical protein